MVRRVLIAVCLLVFLGISVAAAHSPAVDDETATGDIATSQGEVEWQSVVDVDGSDGRFRTVVEADGGYVAVGDTGGERSQALLARFGESGDVEWTERFGEMQETHATSLDRTDDGGFIVSGYTGSNGSDYDLWLAKMGSDGDVAWSETYDLGLNAASFGCWVTSTADGGFAVAVFSTLPDGSGVDAGVLKVDGSGEVAWERTVERSGDDYLEYVDSTSDGGLVFAGRTSSVGDDMQAWVLGLDREGAIAWNGTFGDAGHDAAWRIVEVDDGYVVAGDAGDGNTTNPMLATVDDEGGLDWMREYDVGWQMARGVTPRDHGYDVAVTRHPTTDVGPNEGVGIVTADGDGRADGVRTFDGEGSDAAWDMKRTASGSYLLAGETRRSGDSDPMLMAVGGDVSVDGDDADGHSHGSHEDSHASDGGDESSDGTDDTAMPGFTAVLGSLALVAAFALRRR